MEEKAISSPRKMEKPSSHPDLSWVFFASLRDPGNTEVSVVWQKEIRSHSVAVGSDWLL